VNELTLAEIVAESALGEELAGATPATLAAVIEAARSVEEELAALLVQIGKPAPCHARLKQALLLLDRELTR
jgi:hypothetical protein